MERSDDIVKKVPGPSDHLANERTFLAWTRTSLALMGFGFVIVKFALFLHQISTAFNESSSPGKDYSALIGIIMVIMGAVLATLSFIRYRKIEKQLNKGIYVPSVSLSAMLTVFIIIGSVLLVIYLLQSI